MPDRLKQRIYKSLFIIESDHTKSDLINYSFGKLCGGDIFAQFTLQMLIEMLR